MSSLIYLIGVEHLYLVSNNVHKFFTSTYLFCMCRPQSKFRVRPEDEVMERCKCLFPPKAPSGLDKLTCRLVIGPIMILGKLSPTAFSYPRRPVRSPYQCPDLIPCLDRAPRDEKDAEGKLSETELEHDMTCTEH